MVYVIPYYCILFLLAFLGIGKWQDGSWDFVSFIRFCLSSAVITYSVYFNETSFEQAYLELTKVRARERQLSLEKEQMASSLLQQKDRFLADISHELRTPLTVLKVQLELLQDGMVNDQERVYQTLQHRLDSLNQLVNDLHQIALSDSGLMTLEKTEVDIVMSLKEIIDSFAPIAIGRNIEISLTVQEDSSATVEGDEGRLTQVFINIIKNSLDYTNAGGRLEIDYRESATQACLSFSDTAPSVSENELNKLFERLYRVEASRSRKTGGSGLGLSISKSIIEAHGGTISAQNSPLGGLCIKVDLPRKGAATHPN